MADDEIFQIIIITSINKMWNNQLELNFFIYLYIIIHYLLFQNIHFFFLNIIF